MNFMFHCSPCYLEFEIKFKKEFEFFWRKKIMKMSFSSKVFLHDTHTSLSLFSHLISKFGYLQFPN